MTTFAQDFEEMMNAWSTLESQAKAAFPGASSEEIFNRCALKMDDILRLKN